MLEVLEAHGPEMPIVVLCRNLGVRPSEVTPVLDDLHDAGLIAVGAEPRSVLLVPERSGRFIPSEHPRRART